jgi:transposase
LERQAALVDELELFTAALGLRQPWRVTRTYFDEDGGQLDLYVDFPRGARFPCPAAGCEQSQCGVHDSENKTWRHMDFFQHKAFLHARVPRVRCVEHGVRQVALSWARPESGFTLLFEALLITYAAAMPVARLAAMVREHDTRIWRVLEHHVNTQRAKLSFAEVTKVGMDETAAARGQDYVTVFMDLVKARVLFATEGRDADTVQRFAADLAAHGGDPARISDTSSDMSPAFINGIGEHLPNAKLTFDRFHIAAKLGEKVDEVRRGEQKTNPALNKTRYVWLKNRQNLTAKQQQTLAWLTRPSMRLATARAHRWREDFQEFYARHGEQAEAYLRSWCYGAKRSRLEPIKDFVRLVEEHWDGIIAWHRSRISNGLLEGTNSLIQAAKARARGYRSKRKMIAIVYLIAAKLPSPSPYVTHPI